MFKWLFFIATVVTAFVLGAKKEWRPEWCNELVSACEHWIALFEHWLPK